MQCNSYISNGLAYNLITIIVSFWRDHFFLICLDHFCSWMRIFEFQSNSSQDNSGWKQQPAFYKSKKGSLSWHAQHLYSLKARFLCYGPVELGPRKSGSEFIFIILVEPNGLSHLCFAQCSIHLSFLLTLNSLFSYLPGWTWPPNLSPYHALWVSVITINWQLSLSSSFMFSWRDLIG
jgi:hypothetical protein